MEADLTGHKTKKSITIYKGVNPPTGFITTVNVTPESNVSANNPAIVTAEALRSIVWDVKVIDPDGNVIPLAPAEGKTYSGQFTPASNAVNGIYKVVIGPQGGTEADQQVVEIVVNNNRVNVASVQMLNAKGDSVNGFSPSESMKAEANLNILDPAIKHLTVIFQVKDSEDAVVYLEEVSVQAMNVGSNKISANIPLADFASGDYKIEVYVWDNLDNPVPLAESVERYFTVQ